MKIQFSQEKTPETNQVYEKLLDVSVNAYTNERSQELTSLSKEQQKIIFDILNEVDLSTAELRKNLFRRIEGDPKIARVVHLAITSKKTIEDDYLAFDQELIRSHIEALEEIVIKTSDPQHRDELAHDFWDKYRGLFDKKALESLSTDDLYKLISLLSKTEVLTIPKHKTVLQDLPENGKKYYQALQLDPSKFWKEICKMHPTSSEDRFIALSLYIFSKEMLFKDIQSLISSDDLSKLLPHLRFGNFYGVNDAVITSTLQKARKLEFIHINSRTIKILPELPACKYLKCCCCPSLTKLPQLPACTRLECSGCLKLEKLPELPACECLNCSVCTSLTALPELPVCNILSCFGCTSLAALPELPACTYLNCSDCPSLTALPELPKCTCLNCVDCRALTALPELPVCNILSCFGCTSLAALPELPACTRLECSSCTSLTALPALPACTNLNCSDCRGLVALSELPVCRGINCNDCSNLRELPQTLPACETFRCENCPSLSGMLPELPLTARVYTGNSSRLEFIQLEVDLEELFENPRKSLLELGSHLLQNKPFPNIYYRLNGEPCEAIDIGGLRRDFISRLMESLFKEGASNGNLLINFEKLPQLNNQEDIDAYRTIGRIFALCYPERSYFKTGALFSPEIYKKITLLADVSLAAIDIASDKNVVSTYLHYRNFAEFLKLIDRNDGNMKDIKNDVLTHAYAFVNMTGDVEAARSFFKKKENRDLLKTEIIAAAKSDPQFQAIRLIAQEMKKALDADSWKLLHQQESSKIQERIEGVLSKEALLNKLEWEETPSSASIDQKLKDKTKGYLKSWIERASIEDLRKFVRAVSSSNTLGPNMLKIQLFNRGAEFIPVARTCFFTLELSADYPNQETFDNKINVLLTEGMAGSGFQIA